MKGGRERGHGGEGEVGWPRQRHVMPSPPRALPARSGAEPSGASPGLPATSRSGAAPEGPVSAGHGMGRERLGLLPVSGPG